MVLAGLGAAAAGGSKGSDSGTAASGSVARGGRKTLTRENCVLVFGASGRSGQACVKAILASGRSVVAACRSGSDVGMKAGEQENGSALFVETGVDVTRAGSIKNALFKGVTQVSHPHAVWQAERSILF